MKTDVTLSAAQEAALKVASEGADRDDYECLFAILDKCDGCVPEDCRGDDLLCDIRKKFDIVFASAMILAEKETGAKLDLLVDASFDDKTNVIVVDSEKPYVYLRFDAKAWHFHFEAIDELADYILNMKYSIVTNIQKSPR